MNDKKLINLIKKVGEESVPNFDWKASNREILLNQISSQVENSTTQKSTWNNLKFGFNYFSNYIFNKEIVVSYFRPLASVSLAFVLFMGAGFMAISGSRKSLPGDKLYYVKRAIENGQLKLALNDEEKLILHMNIASERVKEIGGLKNQTEQQNDSVIIGKTAIALKKSIEFANDSLTQIKNSDNTETLVKVSKIINEKTSEMGQSLAEVKNDGVDVKDNILVETALASVSDIGAENVNAVIRKYEEDKTSIEEGEIVYLLNKQFEELNLTIFKIENNINELNILVKDINEDFEVTEINSKLDGVKEELILINTEKEKVYSFLDNKDYFSVSKLILEIDAKVKKAWDRLFNINKSILNISSHDDEVLESGDIITTESQNSDVTEGDL